MKQKIVLLEKGNLLQRLVAEALIERKYAAGTCNVGEPLDPDTMYVIVDHCVKAMEYNEYISRIVGHSVNDGNKGPRELTARRMLQCTDKLPQVLEAYYKWTGDLRWLDEELGYLKAVVALPVVLGAAERSSNLEYIYFEAHGDLALVAAAMAWSSGAKNIVTYSYDPFPDETPKRIAVCLATQDDRGNYSFFTGTVKRKQVLWPATRLSEELRRVLLK